MINEWEEFCAYTGTVSYTASRKSDTTYLGRFTFVTILEFEGMARILTILARGYLFHDKSGAVALGDPRDRIAYARRRSAPGAALRSRTKQHPRTNGSSGRTFRNCARSSRSWWVADGPAGFSAMSWPSRISC